MTKEKEKKYLIEVNERQLRLLSWACDRMARIIEGQDHTYQEFMEMAWEKRCKEATGESMDAVFEGGWYKMRSDAEEICKNMKLRFWGLPNNASYGIRYDDAADTIWDIHRVLRHQLWKENDNRSQITVDAECPTTEIGSEPLIKITRKE